ncbi:syndecan-1 [Pseudonaja textilis]|uniref:Syndecan n=1 Tax=Pseudonaja textilis TaxID=8673 RepID=A0A670ZCW1_PSETE|nr:syndecan-1 [Pseudonaja textilis]
MRVSAIAGLSALVFCFQAVFAQPMDISLPPEDQDSSGDDDDSFSGLSSGAGSSMEDEVIAYKVPLQGSTNTSLMPEVSTSLRDTQTKVQVTDSPAEDYSRAPVSTASIPGFPDSALPSKEPPVTLEEFDSVTEPDTTKPAVLTTSVPIAHHVSTARITTSHTASTVKFIDIPDLSNIDETHSFGIGPESEKNLNSALPTIVSSTAPMDNSPLPENEIFPEYSSGDQGDFIFSTHEENQMNAKDLETENRRADTEAKDAKSEGLMDRKEVLGGVIAGGLVGLLFAGFLVAFMLYRMKKKDEGSYSLDEPKQSNGGYQKPHKQEEFYA